MLVSGLELIEADCVGTKPKEYTNNIKQRSIEVAESTRKSLGIFRDEKDAEEFLKTLETGTKIVLKMKVREFDAFKKSIDAPQQPLPQKTAKSKTSATSAKSKTVVPCESSQVSASPVKAPVDTEEAKALSIGADESPSMKKKRGRPASSPILSPVTSNPSVIDTHSEVDSLFASVTAYSKESFPFEFTFQEAQVGIEGDAVEWILCMDGKVCFFICNFICK